MATKKEIQTVMETAFQTINEKFTQKGLTITTNMCDIQVLAQSKMSVSTAHGFYNLDLKNIEIRRSIVNEVIDTLKQNKHLQMTNIYDFKYLIEVIVHEIGHYIHDTQFNNKDFNFEVMDKYGKKDKYENFAVAFQEYVLNDVENNGIKELFK